MKDNSVRHLDETPQRRWLATVGGLAALVLWSLTVALGRSLSEQLGAVSGAAAAYGVSGAVALAVLLRSGRRWRQIGRLPGKYLVGCGGLFVGYTLVLFAALGMAADRQQSLEVALVNYLWPALTLLLSLLLLGKTARLVLLPATLLTLGGIFLVLTQASPVTWQSLCRNLAGNPAAYALGLAAAVSWASYSALTSKWAAGQSGGAVDLFLPATALVLVLACFFVEEPRAWSLRSSVEAAVLGTATYLAYTLWDAAMRRGNVVLVVVCSYFAPLLSTIVSCVYLGIAPGPKLWIGCGLLIAGSMLSWYSVSETSAKPAAETAPGEA